jgi:hypothetical protein
MGQSLTADECDRIAISMQQSMSECTGFYPVTDEDFRSSGYSQDNIVSIRKMQVIMYSTFLGVVCATLLYHLV